MNSCVGISEAEAKHLHELISTSSSEDKVVDKPGPSKRRKTQDAVVPYFTWMSHNNFVPQNHTFDDTNSGFHPSQNLTAGNILTYFQCFFTQELAKGIAMETYRYFEFATRNANKSRYSRFNYWHETEWKEVFPFLEVTMLISRNKKLKQSECWSQHSLLQTPIFHKVMSRDRREVCMLTTLHTNNIVDTGKKNRHGEPIEKPECVKYYNENMGSIDKIDMLPRMHQKDNEMVQKSILPFSRFSCYKFPCHVQSED
ncbi:hypothetical protein ILUMI_06780 [Ignelater luminosus]|uniref:PiggyBac transposable element-derived protein domain-containing protein n=1 Tax=Ignelater luminosus TaxID=2038154 RepID=A0A8K0DET7_IGNLU|nr:hypothetical protein ILUMI_06780 [Ignelater luminosus]